jgi:hypothetical protein
LLTPYFAAASEIVLPRKTERTEKEMREGEKKVRERQSLSASISGIFILLKKI